MRMDNGDRFPELTADLVDGGRVELPGEESGWTVILFYRGHW